MRFFVKAIVHCGSL